MKKLLSILDRNLDPYFDPVQPPLKHYETEAETENEYHCHPKPKLKTKVAKYKDGESKNRECSVNRGSHQVYPNQSALCDITSTAK
jgi:hypothetical protein